MTVKLTIPHIIYELTQLREHRGIKFRILTPLCLRRELETLVLRPSETPAINDS